MVRSNIYKLKDFLKILDNSWQVVYSGCLVDETSLDKAIQMAQMQPE